MGCHFEREEQHRCAARDFGTRFLVLHVETRGVERHVGGKGGFAHARASGKDQKIRRLQALQQSIDFGETGGDAGNAAAALLSAFGGFNGAAQTFCEIDRAFAIT